MKKYWYQGVTNTVGQQSLLAGPFDNKESCESYEFAVDNLLKSWPESHWWERWHASFTVDKGCGKLNIRLGLDGDERSI